MTTRDLLNQYGPKLADVQQDAKKCVEEAKANYDARSADTARIRADLSQLEAVMNENLSSFSNSARMLRSLIHKVTKTVTDIDQATEAVLTYRNALEEKPAVEARLMAAEQLEAEAKMEWERATSLFNAINKWTTPMND